MLILLGLGRIWRLQWEMFFGVDCYGFLRFSARDKVLGSEVLMLVGAERGRHISGCNLLRGGFDLMFDFLFLVVLSDF